MNERAETLPQEKHPLALTDYGTDSKPELFFGITGAVGTDLSKVAQSLEHQLVRFGYEAVPIHLSKLLPSLPPFSHLEDKISEREDLRIHLLMDAGDHFRKELDRGDAMALLAMAKVRDHRVSKGTLPDKPLNATAYIFHSLKHPEEIQLFRKVYGALFFSISAYCPKNTRLQRLEKKIAKSTNGYPINVFSSEAKELVDRDEKEVGNKLGQNVRDAFPLADAFIDATYTENVTAQMERMVEIVFSHPFRTPSKDELAMFHAKSAALRSSDLSRQVGAIITDKNGNVLSAGCNEVPMYGGGSIWEGPDYKVEHDHRDHRIGHDSTARMKSQIVSELLERLDEHGLLAAEFKGQDPTILGQDLLSGSKKAILADTRIASIIEFGRMVHAEMAAITNAAHRGIKIDDSTLYCTTFPCHMCARHIIASGITRVVYIEPYPKSLAHELYNESISVDHIVDDQLDKVKFDTFVGISPRRFIEFFEMQGERKDRNGYAVSWDTAIASPRVSAFTYYVDMETVFVQLLGEQLPKIARMETPHEENRDEQ